MAGTGLLKKINESSLCDIRKNRVSKISLIKKKNDLPLLVKSLGEFL